MKTVKASDLTNREKLLFWEKQCFSGYEEAPEENKAAFIDGWFRMGDMGYLDEDGYLFIPVAKKN